MIDGYAKLSGNGSVDAETYADAYKSAYDAAKSGRSFEDVRRENPELFDSMEASGVLKQAYEDGRVANFVSRYLQNRPR